MQGFEISESIPASSHIEIVRMAATMCGFMAITYLLGQDCFAKIFCHGSSGVRCIRRIKLRFSEEVLCYQVELDLPTVLWR